MKKSSGLLVGIILLAAQVLYADYSVELQATDLRASHGQTRENTEENKSV
jgi:hypothetical protein